MVIEWFKNLIRPLYRSYKNLRIRLRKPRYDAKVFCIGFNKTGTTTLGKSLEMLGYRNASFNPTVYHTYYKRGEVDKILDYTARFDSTDDLPWLKEDMIPVLDETFPNSKFVYLTRDEETWANSMDQWKKKLTGNQPNLDNWIRDYRKHRRFVLNYFKESPNDRFIILDVSEKGGFKKLADFLGKNAPQEDFPHFNRTSDIN